MNSRVLAASVLLLICFGLVSCGAPGGSPPPGRVYRVGIAPWILDDHHKKIVNAFISSLENSGFNSKSNLDVKIQDASGSARAEDEILREFVRWKADLIFALTADGALSAKSISGDIPVVFADVAYPMELGLVERLEFSSNQTVGIRCYVPLEEQLAFLMRMVPGEVRRLGVCLRAGDPDARLFLDEMRELAIKQGTEVMRIEVSDAASLSRVLSDAGASVDAFYLSCDDLMQGAGARLVVDAASRRGVPVLSCGMAAVEKGALGGVVVDEELAGQMAAAHAAQILGGRSPTSLLTLTVSPPSLVVNQRAARALGIRIPPSFMGEDVHVIE